MVAATDCNDEDEKTGLLSRSNVTVSEDVQDADDSSQIQQEGNEQGFYDSDAGDSDCSVTSSLNVHPHKRRAFFSEKQVDYSTMDESGETTWTDEKHSSYLDSMEATFVQKMYDKEYCSMDVCGHSSTSSITLDHDCVESQPFWLNIRKPFAWKNVGLLTFRAPTRPITPALMLTSPWIQHFKSQKNASCRKGKDAQHLRTKEGPENPSRVKRYIDLTGHGFQSDNGSTDKKRDFASASEAAECKKQKYRHFTLSHMDVLMEKHFNKEQRQKMGINEGSEDEDGDAKPPEHLKNCHEHREEVASCKNATSSKKNLLKEKQKLSTSSIDIEPPSLIVDEAFSRKPDQVVPSCKRMNEEPSVKTPSADLDGDDKDTVCANMGEPTCVSNPSGSKTWTWGSQSARYYAINKSFT